jgi:hypothetical protein
MASARLDQLRTCWQKHRHRCQRHQHPAPVAPVPSRAPQRVKHPTTGKRQPTSRLHPSPPFSSKPSAPPRSHPRARMCGRGLTSSPGSSSATTLCSWCREKSRKGPTARWWRPWKVPRTLQAGRHRRRRVGLPVELTTPV